MFYCSICKKECKNKGGLTKHMNICNETNKKCEYCDKIFYSSQCLKRHLENSCNEYNNILKNKEQEYLQNIEYENQQNKTKIQDYLDNINRKDIEIKQLLFNFNQIEQKYSQIENENIELKKKYK